MNYYVVTDGHWTFLTRAESSEKAIAQVKERRSDCGSQCEAQLLKDMFEYDDSVLAMEGLG